MSITFCTNVVSRVLYFVPMQNVEYYFIVPGCAVTVRTTASSSTVAIATKQMIRNNVSPHRIQLSHDHIGDTFSHEMNTTGMTL